jgi:hypothetical protein
MTFDLLIKEMSREKWKWALSTTIYGALNVIIRIFLIVTSFIVAAERHLVGSKYDFLVQWVPLLALAVTIVTAIDTWLKPRDKWRGFMENRDALSDILIQTSTMESTDNAKFNQLREEFTKLRERHRRENVY